MVVELSDKAAEPVMVIVSMTVLAISDKGPQNVQHL